MSQCGEYSLKINVLMKGYPSEGNLFINSFSYKFLYVTNRYFTYKKTHDHLMKYNVLLLMIIPPKSLHKVLKVSQFSTNFNTSSCTHFKQERVNAVLL